MSRLPADAAEPLLERDFEQHELIAVVERAAAGAGGLIVVEGPAGIGKTRLLDAVRGDAVDRGRAVGRGRGGSLERDVSFGVVHQMFEPLIASVADTDGLFEGAAAAAAAVFGRPVVGSAEDDVGPGTVLHGLYWLTVGLAERLGPLVLLCDDAHWADAPSLRFLAYLVNRVEELPLAIIVGSRPPEDGLEGDILERLLTYQGVRRLRPAPLTWEAVGHIVRRSLDDAVSSFCEAVAEASNGNPFLVSELVRAAQASGTTTGLLHPANLSSLSVDDTVMSRIGALPGAALGVARAVAVLGSDAHLRHVAALAGLGVDEAGAVADQLLRSDILGPDRPLSFVHPLVVGAVYGSMLPGERSVLHRRAAQLLAAEESPAERIAPHIMAIEPAGDPAAIDVLTTAARHGMAQGATELAIAQLKRALAEPPPPDARLGILLPLAIGESLVNDPAAIDHFGEAIDRIPHPATQLKLAGARAATMSMAGRTADGIATLRDFEASSGLPRDLHVHVLAGVNIAASIGPIDGPLLDACMTEFRAALNPAVDDMTGIPADILAIRGFVGALSGESVEVVGTLLDRSLATVDERDPMLPLWVHLIMGALPMIDRDQVADAALDRWLTPARQSGAPAQVGVMLFQRGVIAFRAGDLDDAETDARASLEVCSDYQLRYIMPAPLSVLVDVLRERGDLAGADELLGRYGYERRGAECLFDHLLVFARARLRAAQGRWDVAVDELRRGWADARSSGSGSPGFVAWQANLAEALAMDGRPAEAAETALAAVAEADELGLRRPRGEALRALALADPPRAGELLAEASQTFASLGARLEEARTAAAAIHVHKLGGARPALDSLTQALWLAERCAAMALRDHLRAEMRNLGVRAKVRPVTGIGALTASERRVAMLAGAGRTNKEIAQELFVSVKTVETHMARTFQKLGISSRGELRDALSQPA